MSIQTRLKKLENGHSSGLTVFANVPLDWGPEEAVTRVREAAEADGVVPPFGVFPVHIRGLQSVELTGVGSMSELLSHVAVHGKRLPIDEAKSEAMK